MVNLVTGNIVFQWDSNINKSDGPHHHIKDLDEGLSKRIINIFIQVV